MPGVFEKLLPQTITHSEIVSYCESSRLPVVSMLYHPHDQETQADHPTPAKAPELIPGSTTLLADLRELIEAPRSAVAQAVNSAQVMLYWQVGHGFAPNPPGQAGRLWRGDCPDGVGTIDRRIRPRFR